jgi:putative spermidine/putrescine transport system ATP-binding protein
MSMLTLEKLTKRYASVTAVDAADLTVTKGELVCLLGPSGCGKSTLLRMVSGLIDNDGGRITLDGADMTRVPANRRPTAMVFQSHALWTHMTVQKNVAFGLKIRRVPADIAKAKVAEALKLVGLAGYEHRYPRELSGGQAQRVSIARCLVVEPKLLLMDEPFSALDAHLRLRLREEVKLIQERLGLTILFVTHDQEEAMEIADRIVVMNAGRIEQVGRPSDLYAEPETLFVAGFVGQMNLAPVHVTGGVCDWHGARLATALPDGAYTAAVRPEDLKLGPTDGVAGRIERIVNLGPVLRVHLETAVGALKLQLAASAAAGIMPGDTVHLAPAKLRLYADDHFAGLAEPIRQTETAA